VKPLSIGARLALLNAAVVAAALLALGGVLFALVDRALLHGADGILRDEIAEMALPLRSGPMTAGALREMLRAEAAEHPKEILAFRVTREGGEEVSRTESPAWDHVPQPRPAAGHVPSAHTVRIPGDPNRLRVVRMRVPSVSFGPVEIEAAHHLTAADAALEDFLQGSLLLLPSLLLVSLGAGYFLARRALLPVGRMDAAARRIGTGPAGERLPQTGTGDEIDRLADTLNGMLARIEEALARNQRFSADVAHEVRTPLATIRARLESLPGGDGRIDAAVREVERLEAMVSSLLHISRADERAAGPDSAALDLGAVAAEVAEFFGPAAAAEGVHLAVEVEPGLAVRGEAVSIRRALANLVDNALHASGPGDEVTIRGSGRGGRVLLEVLDRGCGVPEESRARVFDRFFRGFNGRARHPGGSGLGLALVRAVARSHGGEASYAPRPGGGSSFSIDLPPAERPKS